MLTINLEENDCLTAWVSAKDSGMSPPNDVQDLKCK